MFSNVPWRSPTSMVRNCESASNFLDDLEMAFLVSGRDD